MKQNHLFINFTRLSRGIVLSALLFSAFMIPSGIFGLDLLADSANPFYASLQINYEPVGTFMPGNTGFSLEGGFNFGKFIDKNMMLTPYFGVHFNWGSYVNSAFRADMVKNYNGMDYPASQEPKDLLTNLQTGKKTHESRDQLIGFMFKLSPQWFPPIKISLMERLTYWEAGSSGNGTVYVSTSGRTSTEYDQNYLVLMQGGLGLEAILPVYPLKISLGNNNGNLVLGYLSVHMNILDLKTATFDKPKPLFGEFFTEDFNNRNSVDYEFGISLGFGIL